MRSGAVDLSLPFRDITASQKDSMRQLSLPAIMDVTTEKDPFLSARSGASHTWIFDTCSLCPEPCSDFSVTFLPIQYKKEAKEPWAISTCIIWKISRAIHLGLLWRGAYFSFLMLNLEVVLLQSFYSSDLSCQIHELL